MQVWFCQHILHHCLIAKVLHIYNFFMVWSHMVRGSWTCNNQIPHHIFLAVTLPESLNGLGSFTPHRSAITSFVASVVRSIQCAILGIKLNGSLQKCNENIRRARKDWTSLCSRLIHIHCCLASDIAKLIDRPKQHVHTDPLEYLTLCHPLNSLQHNTTRLEAKSDLQTLPSNPASAAFLHKVKPLSSTSTVEDDGANDNNPLLQASSTASIHITTPLVADIYPVIISSMQSTAGSTPLNITRTIK
mmetsp:Transcript_25609/g.75582  ORF Transcript_25609/g.75582 Transcript_25609/m.75582 type:complete len:246 (+) Transcript_25609:106-843(+)